MLTRRTIGLLLIGPVLLAGSALVGPRAVAAQGGAAPAAVSQASPNDVAIRALLLKIETALQRGDTDAYRALLTDPADPSVDTFTSSEFRPGVTRVVVVERDRQPVNDAVAGTAFSLTVDVFAEYGDLGRVATWLVEVRRIDNEQWLIAKQSLVSAVENLYRLSLNTTQQFDAHNFTIVAEDLELTLVSGSVFQVETDQGVTGLVLLGRGEMVFHPSPRTEIEQVRIFAGTDTIESRFDAAFIRVGQLDVHADPSVLKARDVDPRDARRAEQVFREESIKSFVVDLSDLSRDTWSLLPGLDDFLAEVRTRRWDTLTYARSAAEAEDISFFERRRHRNIAVYASKDKLAARGRFYNEDDLAEFEVLDYDIDVAFLPERKWIDGTATLRVRVKVPHLGQLTLHLADTLAVRSVVSDRFGRLFNLRVANQNMVLVNLPTALSQDSVMNLRIDYGGRLDPQPADRENLGVAQNDLPSLPAADDPLMPRPEASYLYSNRSFWYPQPAVSGYATATIRVTVPGAFQCIASGEPLAGSPIPQPSEDGAPPRMKYVFAADRPLRYLSFIVSRFVRADRWTVAFDGGGSEAAPQGAPPVGSDAYTKLDLIVDANPRLVGRGRNQAARAVDIAQFYQSVMGDSPYSTFTVALIENLLPGGHSPGYFAALNEPLTNTGLSWRNDPASFGNYPEFFLAHEIAHQWWGQAVGGQNYHEQWISEGFAQYFAALYADHFRGPEVFEGVLRQMRKWAIDQSDQGPIYLGYRVGHIRNDGRAFRAVVYNKGAVVLHMLRRLVGDEAFFRGIRRFYAASRFHKVGADDFRLAVEAESGRSLERFFERWIYNSTLPRIAFSYHVERADSGDQVVLHFQQSGEIFDLPITVTLQFTDHKPVDIVVPVTDQVVDFRAPLAGTLRSADVSKDDGSLVEVRKGT